MESLRGSTQRMRQHLRGIFARRPPQSDFEAVCHEIFVDYDVSFVAIFATQIDASPTNADGAGFFQPARVVGLLAPNDHGGRWAPLHPREQLGNTNPRRIRP